MGFSSRADYRARISQSLIDLTVTTIRDYTDYERGSERPDDSDL